MVNKVSTISVSQVCIISGQDVKGCVTEHMAKTMDDNAYTCNTDGGNKILRNSDSENIMLRLDNYGWRYHLVICWPQHKSTNLVTHIKNKNVWSCAAY